jgi:hypothetical protein
LATLVGSNSSTRLCQLALQQSLLQCWFSLYHQLSSIFVPTKGHDSDKSIGVGGLATILATGVWGWFLFDHAKGPIIWMFGDGPHPIFGMRGGGSERPFISMLQISGNNRSDEPVSNVDGFLRSNITNKKLPLFFQINGKYVRTIDTNGVPPHADFMIVVPFTDNQAKFGNNYNPVRSISFRIWRPNFIAHVRRKRSPYVRNFPREELAGVIDEFEKSLRESILQKPTITLK